MLSLLSPPFHSGIRDMSESDREAMSSLEYHLLLALVGGPRYGYAVKSDIEAESGGTLSPGAGSLYRVIARLIDRGWVEETAPDEPDEPHPGRARKYYALTVGGRLALADEAARLREAAALAEERLGALKGRP